jgi:hypothetical protein
MIQSALENKYCFHMQVSARAISALGKAARSRKRRKMPLAEPDGCAASTHVHGNVLLDQQLCGFCPIDGQAREVSASCLKSCGDG